MENVALELLGRQIAQLLDGQRRIEERLSKLDDDMLVLTGVALRLEGREVETRGLLALVKRIERRVEALEAR
jgi:hypothetical protein